MEPILKVRNMTKTFPGVVALNGVSVDIYPGEVHAMIGENGAGKSTLIKLLSGVYQPDSGTIEYQGNLVAYENPHAAILDGIAVIHQELSIADDLTVAENIFLGSEPKKGNFLNRREMNKRSQEIIDFMEVDIDATEIARNLTVAEKQMVEIAKVINRDAKVVIMDEPTSSLSDHEIQALFRQVDYLIEKNVAIIYISHRMPEIFEICHRATVLRDGEKIITTLISEITESELVVNMVGRQIDDYFIREKHERGEEMLRVEGLTREGEFSDISFTAYAGEILGFSGLVGAGRTEVMETIFGARPKDSGTVTLLGEEVNFASPKEAIDHNLGMVTEDRRGTGLMLAKEVKDNVVLPTLATETKFFADDKWEEKVSREMVEKLNVKTPSIHTIIGNLSGGNQQKVVLSKWLVAESKILILDEPTRGIDVNAKSEFYELMNQFVSEGGCIIMVSSELPEVIGVSDRIIVMCEGKITGELPAEGATEEQIISLASVSSENTKASAS